MPSYPYSNHHKQWMSGSDEKKKVEDPSQGHIIKVPLQVFSFKDCSEKRRCCVQECDNSEQFQSYHRKNNCANICIDFYWNKCL